MLTCGLFTSVRSAYRHYVEVQSKPNGHGAFIDQETVISSVAGAIERINKLVSVRAIRTRYSPKAGDLIVGRITKVWPVFRPPVGYVLQVNLKVQPRRWKVDMNSRQDTVLMLSSINLPGGVQVGGFVSLYGVWPGG